MSTVNQLLAKAMSTSSDDEAVACLKMARKKGNSLEVGSGSVEYKGQSAKYWYDKAVTYYNAAKKKQEVSGLSPDQQVHLYNMYKHVEHDNERLRAESSKLQKENSILKLKISKKNNEYIYGVIIGVIFSMIPAFIFFMIM